MPIHLNNKNGTRVHHCDGDNKSQKYSIFGVYDMMNYAYVTISNKERNNRGLYTESNKKPEYYQEGIIKLENKNPINAPVWTLLNKDQAPSPPLTPKYQYHQQQLPEPEQLPVIAPTPPITNENKLVSKKFVWLYGGKDVILTGTFDNWQASIPMTPVNTTNINNNVFQTTIDLDLSKDVLYKFIVDGKWCYDMKKDYVVDATGNINNIIYTDKN